ncbi:hypothetical protein TVAG_213240 [Trichomonas vaginalis G3]|uniref:Tectonic-1-3 N-terminal domain-containing protein n=1 Tax=Trichomonas vaginalis (strain ATCC PRA-98 / G3) TaxID=412133 RepID=A2EEU9_TRIV3|nr:protein of unknown function, DUF1619 family [Trichomonas vaginalis G3]EAY08815.1 hypothetical protein TVAG_213240 [Trichomonas vaginalis G3]KAI5542035.1 protein of unknown function, DUF1619 family [Trichomonas vaginalis G3]|eukprot:XP_001321038.1 hypothetical protein [Trichomonas vaginalis G3]
MLGTFPLFLAFGLTASNTTYAESVCDCDVTDKCDLYCCCDRDCDSASIDKFKEQFCIPESKNPLKKIVCDSNNRIAKSHKIDTFILNDEITCYYVDVPLDSRNKIENYSPEDLGTDSFAQFLPTVELPNSSSISDNSDYPPYKNESTSNLLYSPFGVGSLSCNSFILVRENTDYNTTCVLLESEIANGPLMNFGNVLSNQFCAYTGLQDCSSVAGVFLTIGSTGITGSATTSTATVDFVYTSQADAEEVATKGSGYISGLYLSSATRLDLETPIYKYFKFNGYNVKFGGINTAYYNTSNSLHSSDIFLYTNIFPTYASFPASGVSKYAAIEMPELNISAGESGKTVIYSLLFKKYGYKTAFYYRFVNVTMQILDTPENLYHTVQLRQIELSDDADSELEVLDSTPYTPKFSNIFQFLFDNTEEVVRTIGIISLFIIIILVWLDTIFNQ